MTSAASAMMGSMAISTATTPLLPTMMGLRSSARNRPLFAIAKSSKGDQQGRERFHVGAVAAARAFEQRSALDAVDHREGAVVRQRRHLGHRVIQDFDEYAPEAEADRGTEQGIVDDAGIGLRDALDHRLDQHAALETGVARISRRPLHRHRGPRCSSVQPRRTQPRSLLCSRPGASALTATAVLNRRSRATASSSECARAASTTGTPLATKACRAVRKSHRDGSPPRPDPSGCRVVREPRWWRRRASSTRAATADVSARPSRSISPAAGEPARHAAS